MCIIGELREGQKGSERRGIAWDFEVRQRAVGRLVCCARRRHWVQCGTRPGVVSPRRVRVGAAPLVDAGPSSGASTGSERCCPRRKQSHAAEPTRRRPPSRTATVHNAAASRPSPPRRELSPLSQAPTPTSSTAHHPLSPLPIAPRPTPCHPGTNSPSSGPRACSEFGSRSGHFGLGGGGNGVDRRA